MQHMVWESLQFFVVMVQNTISPSSIRPKKSDPLFWHFTNKTSFPGRAPFLVVLPIHPQHLHIEMDKQSNLILTWGLLSPPILLVGPPFSVSCYWFSHTIESLTTKWWPAFGPSFLIYTNLKIYLHFQYTKQLMKNIAIFQFLNNFLNCFLLNKKCWRKPKYNYKIGISADRCKSSKTK